MNIKHILLLLSIVALTACSENDDTESRLQTVPSDNYGTEELIPVQFSVSSLRNIDFTRASTSIVTFDSNEAIKVFVKPNGSASYTGYDYITASTGQNNVTLTAPATPPYYPVGPGTWVEAYAYYPSTAGATFTVQDDQTSDANYKNSDLMYAVNRKVTKGSGDGNNNLTMEHQMAQLAITAQAQSGSGLTICGVEVEALKSVTFNHTPSAPSRVTATGSTGTITALNAAGTGFVLIPPQVINGVIIKVKTGSGTNNETATYAFTGTSGTFQSGASYGINLTVSPDQLGLTSSINDWNGLGSVNVTPSGNLTISSISAQEYTGSEIRPGFTVYRNGALFDSENYNVQWVNNIKSGTAYVIVTGKNMGTGADYSTCIGLASFTITPANGKIEYGVTALTKTYGNEPFTNPLSNFDTRPEHAGQAADGEVTYVSSNPTVASVNEITGEVTILKAGSTTITATASNGANYVYSTADGDNTSSYVLTVNKAVGSISFADDSPRQTWSPTTANVYTGQTLTNNGDPEATITYSVPAINDANNTCGATIDSNTGAVSFSKSGAVRVTATVTDTERYIYAPNNSIEYTLYIDKATGSISFADLSPSTYLSITAANNIYTQTVTKTGDGSVTYGISGTNTCGASVNSSTGAASYTMSGMVQITATISDTEYYTYPTSTVSYTLTVNSSMETVSKNDVGKVLARDGKIYANVDATTAAGTTASGIIAYVSENGTIVESNSSSYKCLVIALTDASESSTNWNTVNNGTCVLQTDNEATAFANKAGYQSTYTLQRSLSGSGKCQGHTHNAAKLAWSYGTTTPTGASHWFLPTIGQWNLIVQGLATKKAGYTVTTNLKTADPANENNMYKAVYLNSIILGAQGSELRSSFYASSTEYNTGHIWDIHFNYGYYSINTKGGSYIVRPVFAF